MGIPGFTRDAKVVRYDDADIFHFGSKPGFVSHGSLEFQGKVTVNRTSLL